MSYRSIIHRSGAWVSWSVSPAEGSTKSAFFNFHINLQIPLYVVILSGVGFRGNTIIFIFIGVLFTPLDPSCGVSGLCFRAALSVSNNFSSLSLELRDGSIVIHHTSRASKTPLDHHTIFLSLLPGHHHCSELVLDTSYLEPEQLLWIILQAMF
ncbi:uncharacterized protein LOC110294737 [Mus caroli]|uniref:Uncharacterized protein LOC110294737 n=1 Tax=Mus caroli TaxID=10089 RepID=A0A6P5PR06_MUSCR|nr:uncharacterized protein LOC110294737 [Mus caroli]